jgi:hypothetical protein
VHVEVGSVTSLHARQVNDFVPVVRIVVVVDWVREVPNVVDVRNHVVPSKRSNNFSDRIRSMSDDFLNHASVVMLLMVDVHDHFPLELHLEVLNVEFVVAMAHSEHQHDLVAGSEVVDEVVMCVVDMAFVVREVVLWVTENLDFKDFLVVSDKC